MGIRMTLLQNPDINRWWIDPSLRTPVKKQEPDYSFNFTQEIMIWTLIRIKKISGQLYIPP
jgi:hypothetical protein